jgi:general secretion pathway protein G
MREPGRRRSQAGVGKFELLVCTAVFGIFLGVFIERSFYYQEWAEKSAMELTAEHIKTGMRYRVADLIIANRMSEIPTLADENPMDWLEQKPPNYAGERDSSVEAPQGGTWYFDRKNRELVYAVNNRRHFSPSSYRDFAVHYRVLPVAPPAGAKKPGEDQVWVTFVPVSEYRWLQ